MKGFIDPRAARRIVRRMKIRTGLVDLQRSAEALLDVLDQRIEADGHPVASLRDSSIALRPSDCERLRDAKPCLLYTSPSPRD